MESSGYLHMLRRHIVLVIATALLGLVVAAGAARSITPTYHAQATLFLKVQSGSTSLYERSQFALQRVQSYPQLLESPALLQKVKEQVGLTLSTQQLAAMTNASNPANTVLVNVTADAPSGELAAAIANAAADQLASSVDALENAQASTKNAVILAPQIRAQAPTAPSSPNIPVLLGLGVLAGLVLGYLLAILLETVRPTMRTPEHVRRVTGLPVVAQMPTAWIRRRHIAGSEVTDLAADNLRAISRGALPPLVVLAPADSPSRHRLTRYMLARGLADSGRRVAVIETTADARLPKGLTLPPHAAGLSEVLAEKIEPAHAVIPHALDRLAVVPVGDVDRAPSQFETERRLPSALREIVRRYDTTVLEVSEIDRPVSLIALAPSTPGALLVVSRRWTSEKAARRLLAKLRVLAIVPIGVVMVDVPSYHTTDLLSTWTEGDFVTIAAVDDAHRCSSADPQARIETQPERRYASPLNGSSLDQPDDEEDDLDDLLHVGHGGDDRVRRGEG